MYHFKIIVFTITLFLMSCGFTQASETTQKVKVVKVLTIGNSFSQNASSYIKEIAAASGNTLIIGHADIGGCWLGKHWAAVEAAEANLNDPAGKPYSVTVGSEQVQRSLREILTQDKWDFVTLQQASIMSPDQSTYEPFARNLRDYIKKNAPHAEVVVHETWAYRCDDPLFTVGEDSQEKMYNALSNAYRTMAAELDLRIMPVGDAFYLADTNAVWRYRPAEFDSAHAVYPNLPNQENSLHVGWQWGKDAQGKHNLYMDGHHANANGCYLAGCVWFEVLFGESVVDNKFTPSDVTPEDAKFLRRVAHKAVQLQNAAALSSK